MSKRLAFLLTVLWVAGCGGGGGDSGASGFASAGASAPVAGNPTGGGLTPGGGISIVSTGQPNQRSMSLSVEKYGLDWSTNGDMTMVTVWVADTAGNPVPDGTPVQFSTQGGQIQTSCRLTGVVSGTATISACSVTYVTQNPRPLDGYIAVLAWLEGDEAFVDSNGDGVYTAGEPFFDSGRIFRDDDKSSAFSPGDELNVGNTLSGTPGLGTAACGPSMGATTTPVSDATFGFIPSNAPASVPDTCDGSWGRTLIRAATYLPVSDPRYLQLRAVAGGVEVSTQWAASFSNRAAAPAGTTVSLVGTPPMGCTLSISPPMVPSAAIGPTLHRIIPTGATCAGGTAVVKATFGAYEQTVSVTY